MQQVTAVIGSLGRGGAERQILTLCEQLASFGVKVRLVTFREEQNEYPLSTNVSRETLNYQGSRFPLIRNLRRVWSLRKKLKTHQSDLALAFMDATNVVTILASLGLGISVVVCERTNVFKHNPGWQWILLRRLVYPFASAVVVQSERAAAFFQNWSPYFVKQVAVIPNFLTTPQQLHFEKEGNEKKIVSLGRLTQEKGYDLLLHSFANVDSSVNGWKLEVWGEGPERSKLEEMRKELKLEDSVKFCGSTSNPWEVLADADIYVCPSRYEGFPNALAEAMSFGKAVVSFDCPHGPREIVDHGVNGILVPEASTKAMSEALQELMRDVELRGKLGRNASTIREKLAPEKIWPKWKEVLLREQGRVASGV